MLNSDCQDDESTLEFTLNTLTSPYKVDLVSPLLTDSLGSDRMFVMVDYQPGTQLTAQSSYKDLKLEMRTGKTAEGRQFFVEMWREGTKNINYDLDVQYEEVREKYLTLIILTKYSSVRPTLRSTSTPDLILTSSPSLSSTHYSARTAPGVSSTDNLWSTSSLTTRTKTCSPPSSV